MGDRATIEVKSQDRSVWLYTHWRGSETEDILKTALRRRQRWNNASYLARIIFCEMVKGAEADETGFGISAFDLDERNLCVDVDKQTVNGKPFASFIK